ncbi:hypothetical protein HMPREF1247_0612 [Atopobium sp. BV3Ac4]|nr:hypothetical protein HMPREF1247_0612 [Atopobium sp. BV3Ac4]
MVTQAALRAELCAYHGWESNVVALGYDQSEREARGPAYRDS